MKSIAKLLDERDAKARNGVWVPACNQTEVPITTRNGRRLLYCFQPSSGKHAYLDLATDIILSDEEALAIMLNG